MPFAAIAAEPSSESAATAHYWRTLPAEVDGVGIVTGTVAANGNKLEFVTTASTV
jgi:hypothetical protein